MVNPSAVADLENDLPSVANHAAIELDNMLLERPGGLDSVRTLASRISDAVGNVQEPASASSLLDVGTAVVLNRAMGDSTGPTNRTLQDLVEKTKELARKLLTLKRDEITAPEHKAELELLRLFCVSLSQHAMANEASPDDRPEHPFRR
jgi:hypothetical protein